MKQTKHTRLMKEYVVNAGPGRAGLCEALGSALDHFGAAPHEGKYRIAFQRIGPKGRVTDADLTQDDWHLPANKKGACPKGVR